MPPRGGLFSWGILMLTRESAARTKQTAEDPSPRAHLLVVDDDPRIRSMLLRYFEGEGFRVSLAGSGAQMRQCLVASHVDLILLDLGLPDADGLSIAQEVRSHSELGIIMLTGRSDDVDRVVGLEIGADDYIAKPFNLREVLARVKSVLRRLHPASPLSFQETGSTDVLRFDGWLLDRGRRQLTSPTGQDIPLTTGEYDLLTVFLDHAGRVLTRDYLMDQTRGRTWDVFDRTVDAQVSRLRRKIEQDIQLPKILKSIRGVGYIFTAKVERGPLDPYPRSTPGRF